MPDIWLSLICSLPLDYSGLVVCVYFRTFLILWSGREGFRAYSTCLVNLELWHTWCWPRSCEDRHVEGVLGSISPLLTSRANREDRAATVIQCAFRKLLARKELGSAVSRSSRTTRAGWRSCRGR